VAEYDSVTLYERFKMYQRRPEQDEKLDSDGVYALLSDAQQQVVVEIANHVPHMLLGPPTQMVTADNGLTYTFGTDGDGDNIFPIGSVEIAARNGRSTLYASAYADGSLDYVLEGDRIRMPRGRARTFTSGPYARFITPPPEITAVVQPMARIKPKSARMLIVYRALVNWANLGGELDPRPFEEMYHRLLWGDGMDVGLMYTWKTQHSTQQYAANWKAYFERWWEFAEHLAASEGVV
jgi:hypothetical protein